MALQIYYDKDADLARLAGKTVAIVGYGSQGHAHALNLSRSGVSVVVGLRKDSRLLEQGRGRGPHAWSTPAEAARRADVDHAGRARRDRGRPLQERHRAEPRGRQLPRGGARLQHPLPGDPAAGGRERVHGRAEGPGPHRARALRAGPRRAGADRGPPGSERRHEADRARLREGHRRRTRGHHRDELPRGDRDGSVRRADRAVRRPHRADAGGLRDAGRGRLRARDGVLRDASTR